MYFTTNYFYVRKQDQKVMNKSVIHVSFVRGKEVDKECSLISPNMNTAMEMICKHFWRMKQNFKIKINEKYKVLHI